MPNPLICIFFIPVLYHFANTKKKVKTNVRVSAFVTAGETPGATPADSIQMVPFQFDLIKLLPRCQQIELFFYTFSKGTATASMFAYTPLNTCITPSPQ